MEVHLYVWCRLRTLGLFIRNRRESQETSEGKDQRVGSRRKRKASLDILCLSMYPRLSARSLWRFSVSEELF